MDLFNNGSLWRKCFLGCQSGCVLTNYGAFEDGLKNLTPDFFARAKISGWTVLAQQFLDRRRLCGRRNRIWSRLGLCLVKCLLIRDMLTKTNLVCEFRDIHSSFGREGFMVFMKERASIGNLNYSKIQQNPHNPQMFCQHIQNRISESSPDIHHDLLQFGS